jgi:hypothetical protein
MWGLSPAVQVAVWSLQALLADDKPRTFEEIHQHIGADPGPAIEALVAEGKIECATIEGITFWRRKVRRK